MIDRSRDAADAFTLTGGIGLGAEARIGPLVGGALWSRDIIGLRAGSFELNWSEYTDGDHKDLQLIIFGWETFLPDHERFWARDKGIDHIQSLGLTILHLRSRFKQFSVSL